MHNSCAYAEHVIGLNPISVFSVAKHRKQPILEMANNREHLDFLQADDIKRL